MIPNDPNTCPESGHRAPRMKRDALNDLEAEPDGQTRPAKRPRTIEEENGTVTEPLEVNATLVSDKDPKPVDDQAKTVAEVTKSFKRRKKRKIALFLGYVGALYHGMQKNPGVKTIEGLLEDAIFEAGGISIANQGNMSKVNWSRAARTDKGVSAVGQCVSLKMACEVDGKLDESMIDHINDKLPDDVRCYGMMRPTRAFTARTDCNRRLYEYIMPLRILGGPNELLSPEENANLDEHNNSSNPDGNTKIESNQNKGKANEGRKVNDDDSANDPRVVKFNKILAQFEGTHSFHNFTDSTLRAGDDQAKRYLLSVKAQKPFRIGSVYYISIHLLGQSFIMHQIRKMVALSLHIFHGYCPPETLPLALSLSAKIPIPTAPSLGLFLNTLYFSLYNEHHKDHLKEPVTPDRWKEPMNKFKSECVYPAIARMESLERTMAKWLKTTSASTRYDREDIMARWEKVKAENPPQQSPGERRRARMLIQYPILTETKATCLSQDDVDRIQSSYQKVFQDDDNQEAHLQIGEGEHASTTTKEGTDPTETNCSEKAKPTADFIASAPHAAFLLGPPLCPTLPCLGFATSLSVVTAVGCEKAGDVVRVKDSSSCEEIATLRGTGVRVASKSVDVDRAKSIAAAWKAMIMLAGIPSSVTNGAKVMVEKVSEIADGSVAETASTLLACARLNHRRFLKHQLAELAWKTTKDSKPEDLYLAGFSMCSQQGSLVLYDPRKPTKPPSLYPLSPTVRLVFIEDKSSETSRPVGISGDATKLEPLLNAFVKRPGKVDKYFQECHFVSGKLPTFCERMKELDEKIGLFAAAVQNEDDLTMLNDRLLRISITELLTRSAPKLLYAEDIAHALLRLRPLLGDDDEVLDWCAAHLVGGRRVASGEFIGKKGGVLCAYDAEKKPRFCEVAGDKWGRENVSEVSFVGGAFILKLTQKNDNREGN